MTRHRLQVACGATALLATSGLLTASFLEPPTSWLVAGSIPVLVALVALVLARFHPGYRFHSSRPFSLGRAIPPAALALGGSMFTLQFLARPFSTAALGAAGVGTGVVLYCQYLLATPNEPPPYARLLSNFSVYLSAFLLFVALQSLTLPPVYNALALGAISGFLALELFQEGPRRSAREPIYGAVVALILSEAALVLSYLPLGKVLLGLVLLLLFYLLSGLIHTHLHDRLNPAVAAEFVGVTMLGLAFLYGFQHVGG